MRDLRKNGSRLGIDESERDQKLINDYSEVTFMMWSVDLLVVFYFQRYFDLVSRNSIREMAMERLFPKRLDTNYAYCL